MFDDSVAESRLREVLQDPRWSLPVRAASHARVRAVARRQRAVAASMTAAAAVVAAAAIAVPLIVTGGTQGTTVPRLERSVPPAAHRPAPVRVVPLTVGLSVRAAVAALRAAVPAGQITIEDVPASQPAGTVVAQNPAAGARVPPGAVITLVVSAGKPRS